MQGKADVLMEGAALSFLESHEEETKHWEPPFSILPSRPKPWAGLSFGPAATFRSSGVSNPSPNHLYFLILP